VFWKYDDGAKKNGKPEKPLPTMEEIKEPYLNGLCRESTEKTGLNRAKTGKMKRSFKKLGLRRGSEVRECQKVHQEKSHYVQHRLAGHRLGAC